MKRKIVVGVTGLNATDNPGPGVAVIRSIRADKDFDVRIIGFSYEALEPGLYMHDIVDKTYQIPYPTAGTDSLLGRIKYIHEKENIDVIIPNFDAELYNFIKLSPILKKMGINTFLPDYEQFESRDKIKLSGFAKLNGFNVPIDHVIHDYTELLKLQNKFDYPVVVKGKFYDASIVHNFNQLEKAFSKIQAQWGLPIIIQNFIKGTEINIAALGDGYGNTISAVAMRKLYITDKGKAWAGITIEDNKYMKLAEKFIEVTKWRGGCELEIIVDQQETPYILEVNPRFPAWIYLTVVAGQNQPSALLKMALGETVKLPRTYEIGKMFIRYAWDLITDINEFQKISGNGEL